MAERTGFIFAITFIVLLSTVLATMPAALSGGGETATELQGIDPDLLTDFASTTGQLTRTDFSITGSTYYKFYDLGGHSWTVLYGASFGFAVSRKILWVAGLWFGAYQDTNFYNENGTSRGEYLTMAEIELDSSEGVVRYDLQYIDNANDAGGAIFYWNTTAFATASDAWTGDGLSFIHGMGIDTTASGNVFTLLVQLLTFSLPSVPPLIGVIIGLPVWANVVYLIWFIIKESLPFL